MSHSVTVQSGKNNVQIEGQTYNAGQTVTVSDATFQALTSAGRFTDGTLTDNGKVGGSANDDVEIQGAFVAAPSALTSAAAVGGTPTKAEYDALRTDVSNLRTTVANLLTALKGADKPMAPS